MGCKRAAIARVFRNNGMCHWMQGSHGEWNVRHVRTKCRCCSGYFQTAGIGRQGERKGNFDFDLSPVGNIIGSFFDLLLSNGESV